jgi:hypothetical protein
MHYATALCRARRRSVRTGENMGTTGKKSKPPGKDDDKPKKLPPKRIEDDDYEDGDIATPKRDRYGQDDEPL